MNETYSNDLAKLEARLGISFRHQHLLQQALVHRSFLNENPGFQLSSNERLEFLGDAVLGLVVAQELFSSFPDMGEGELTRLRAMLVQQGTLYRLAERLGLGEHLYLGQGEQRSGGRNKPSNLSSALEAVIGAIYLDQGLETVRPFVLGLMAPEMGGALEEPVDYKSRLQELMHAWGRGTPLYRLACAVGPEHKKTFTVEVLEGETPLASGSGSSKKRAEMAAACAALEALQGTGGSEAGFDAGQARHCLDS